MTDPTQPAAGGGIRSVSVEAAVAAILLLFGLVVAFESWRLGAGWTDDGPAPATFRSTSRW